VIISQTGRIFDFSTTYTVISGRVYYFHL